MNRELLERMSIDEVIAKIARDEEHAAKIRANLLLFAKVIYSNAKYYTSLMFINAITIYFPAIDIYAVFESVKDYIAFLFNAHSHSRIHNLMNTIPTLAPLALKDIEQYQLIHEKEPQKFMFHCAKYTDEIAKYAGKLFKASVEVIQSDIDNNGNKLDAIYVNAIVDDYYEYYKKLSNFLDVIDEKYTNTLRYRQVFTSSFGNYCKHKVNYLQEAVTYTSVVDALKAIPQMKPARSVPPIKNKGIHAAAVDWYYTVKQEDGEPLTAYYERYKVANNQHLSQEAFESVIYCMSEHYR